MCRDRAPQANIDDVSISIAEIEKAPSRLLREGRCANARVTEVAVDGRKWVVKDFSCRSWFVRKLIAPVLISREIVSIRRLKGISGIAQHAVRVGPSMLAIEYIEGRSLDKVAPASVTPEFLEKLEALIRKVHDRGVVHLDLRGGGNIIMRPDGTPGLIDFQSGLVTTHIPLAIVKELEAMDMSGAYKKWLRYQPEAMGEYRREELARVNRLRRFWILHGYCGRRKFRK
ncbi:hypothetical protein [Sutterella seckii]|uniref:Protein kinase domain-containing protein n=1 Tax=Sutterella seckii TaxID=1944635 RepID=A0A6I1ER94_9BURK|nr:hypothetical protein [Sutterella seckii]KAB7661458.1 hypothetical protein GBM95_04560 [Sutterella seckii]MBS5216519.1 hypothetical protein [Sutterella wadsworthensis]